MKIDLENYDCKYLLGLIEADFSKKWCISSENLTPADTEMLIRRRCLLLKFLKASEQIDKKNSCKAGVNK